MTAFIPRTPIGRSILIHYLRYNEFKDNFASGLNAEEFKENYGAFIQRLHPENDPTDHDGDFIIMDYKYIVIKEDQVTFSYIIRNRNPANPDSEEMIKSFDPTDAFATWWETYYDGTEWEADDESEYGEESDTEYEE